MGNFNLNINSSSEYTSKVSYNQYERCNTEVNFSGDIVLLDSDNTQYSVLSSYSGTSKDTLVITSVISSHPNLELHYNSVNVTDNSLPLSIDVSSMLDSDNTGLTVECDIEIDKIIEDTDGSLIHVGNDGDDNLDISYDDLVTTDPYNFLIIAESNTTKDLNTLQSLNVAHTIRIFYHLTNINNDEGDTQSSTFLVSTRKCNTLSTITNGSSGTYDFVIASTNRGLVSFQPIQENRPFYYSYLNLPVGLTYDAHTGYIGGTSQETGVHIITMSITNEQGINELTGELTITNTEVSAPVITSSLTATVSGSNLVYAIEATNDPTYYSFLLPDDLAYYRIINTQDNILELEINDFEPTTYSITITAGNAAGSDSQILELEIL